MRGIILKDLYEGFCIKKNMLNWLISLGLITVLTTVNSMMRGTYGFLLIVVMILPMMGSTLLQMTVEQDEKAEFDRIQLTYPLSKMEIVLSKYLGGLLVQGGITAAFFSVSVNLRVWISDDSIGRSNSNMGNRGGRWFDLFCSKLYSLFLVGEHEGGNLYIYSNGCVGDCFSVWCI